MSLFGTRTIRHVRQQQPRRPAQHPMWCDVTRCLSPYADPVGGHRSEPITATGDDGSRLVVTLVQRAGGPVRAEITVVVDAPVDDPRRQVRFVNDLINDIRAAVGSTSELAALEARRDELLALRGRSTAGGHR